MVLKVLLLLNHCLTTELRQPSNNNPRRLTGTVSINTGNVPLELHLITPKKRGVGPFKSLSITTLISHCSFLQLIVHQIYRIHYKFRRKLPVFPKNPIINFKDLPPPSKKRSSLEKYAMEYRSKTRHSNSIEYRKGAMNVLSISAKPNQ